MESMVRLGSKHTARTEALSLHNQGSSFKLSKQHWKIIESMKTSAAIAADDLRSAFMSHMHLKPTNREFLEFLEFEDAEYYEALCLPMSTDYGMTLVGKGGQAVKETYLLERWASGKDGGIFSQSYVVKTAPEVWRMPHKERQAKMKSWVAKFFEEQAQNIATLGRRYNGCIKALSRMFRWKHVATLNDKRIIGCTTTAAAMYRESIQRSSPDILLVEEAGEILESHVLTALCPETTQLILIGDHKCVSTC
jgi:AAA domain